MTLDDRYFTWSNNKKNLKHLDEVPYRSEVWRERYPELYSILDGDPKLPEGNRFDFNTVIGGKGVVIAAREGFDKFLRYTGNVHVEAPLIGITGNTDMNGNKCISLNDSES